MWVCFWFTGGFGGVSGSGVSRALGLAVCQGPYGFWARLDLVSLRECQ